MEVRFMYKFIAALLLVFFLTGCNNRTDYSVKLNDSMIIDLNSDMTPLNLVEQIDGKKIESKWIKGTKIIYHNFVVECDTVVDSTKEGWYDVVYKTNDINNKEIRTTIHVYDVSAPIIRTEKDVIELFTDEVSKFDFSSLFSITDNGGMEFVKVSLDDSAVKAAEGIYRIFITASDKNMNSSEKIISLTVKDRPVQKPEIIPPSQNMEQNNQTTVDKKPSVNTSDKEPDSSQVDKKPSTNNSTGNTNNSNNSSGTTSTKNPSQYNKYFEGKSIDNYNKAVEYAEALFNSKKVNGFEVMPDGNGFNVSFR